MAGELFTITPLDSCLLCCERDFRSPTKSDICLSEIQMLRFSGEYTSPEACHAIGPIALQHPWSPLGTGAAHCHRCVCQRPGTSSGPSVSWSQAACGSACKPDLRREIRPVRRR